MKTFVGLLKKEMHLTKRWMYATLLGLLGIVLIGFGISHYYDQPIVLLIFILMIYGLHTLFISILLLSSLSIEGRSQLWLHSPQSALALIGSKLLTSLCFQIISITFISIGLYVCLKIYGTTIPYTQVYPFLSIDIFLYSIGITSTGLFFGVLALFYWIAYHAMKNYLPLQSLRIFSLFALFFVSNFLLNKFTQTTFYEGIMKFGQIPIALVSTISVTTENTGFSFGEVGPDYLSIGAIIVYLLVMLVLIFLSSKLLDKAVEM